MRAVEVHRPFRFDKQENIWLIGGDLDIFDHPKFELWSTGNLDASDEAGRLCAKRYDQDVLQETERFSSRAAGVGTAMDQDVGYGENTNRIQVF